MKNIFAICFVFMSGLLLGQSSAFQLGIGKYSYVSYDQFSINFGFEKQLNSVFTLGLNGSFLDESKETNIVLNDTPPVQFYEVTTSFGGFTATSNLDIFLIGFDKKKFQLHIGLGAGILAVENDKVYGLAEGYAEERVQISSNLSAGIGYRYGINLSNEEALQQFYFNVKRHF